CANSDCDGPPTSSAATRLSDASASPTTQNRPSEGLHDTGRRVVLLPLAVDEVKEDLELRSQLGCVIAADRQARAVGWTIRGECRNDQGSRCAHRPSCHLHVPSAILGSAEEMKHGAVVPDIESANRLPFQQVRLNEVHVL